MGITMLSQKDRMLLLRISLYNGRDLIMLQTYKYKVTRLDSGFLKTFKQSFSLHELGGLK